MTVPHSVNMLCTQTVICAFMNYFVALVRRLEPHCTLTLGPHCRLELLILLKTAIAEYFNIVVMVAYKSTGSS